MFHSRDFDLEQCREISSVTPESPAPGWFGMVIVSAGGFYLGAALLAFALLR